MSKNNFISRFFINLRKPIRKAKKTTGILVSKKGKKNLQELIFPVVLVLLALVISVQNYTPGTFLSGWNTLHPEFNYNLNIARTFFGVFRTEQGLGAVASHAHSVELVRIFFLGLFDIFLPQSLVRYSYFFLCLTVGPVGMYYFLKKVFFKRNLPSFMGALFYLLNLGTYQIFVVPFEMFAVLYAMIPWFFLTFDSLLRKSSRKNIALFALVVLLTTPAAYASSLWYLFFAATILYFLPFVIFKSGVKGIVKRFIIAISIILLVNSFWILPSIYFALHDAKYVTQANINKLFSEEAFLKNKEFGNITDILKLKSFYFDWGIYNFSINQFEQITSSFTKHLASPINNFLGTAYAALFILGFLVAVKRYRALSVSLILVILFSLIFLFNNNQPFSSIFNFLQENLPLFKEALRFPHNKIHNLFIFFYALFFAVGVDFIFRQSFKLAKTKMVPMVIAVLIGISLVYYLLPAFSGNFINPQMKAKIPNSYFEMFEYLAGESSGRVASLPVHSPWGWTYNKWDETNSNYQGAGFLYFGIKQSLLDRDFDRWNPLNEQYYMEISNAVYSEDETQLMNVVKKYNITYLLLDKSVVNPGSDIKSLNYESMESMLDNLSSASEPQFSKKTFSKYLTVYKFENGKTFPIASLDNAAYANPYSEKYYKDYIYNDFGDYVSIGNSNFSYLTFINNESKVNNKLVSIIDNDLNIQIPNEGSLNNFTTLPNLIPSQIKGTRSEDGQLFLDIYPSVAKLDSVELVSPIHNEVYLQDNSIIAVNEKVIYLDRVGFNTPTVLDTTILSSGQNSIATFDRDGAYESIYFPSIPITFSYCGAGDNSKIVSSISNTSLLLDGVITSDYCLSIPTYVFTNSTTPISLAKVSFNYAGNNDISACLIKNGEDKCFYNIPVKNLGTFKSIAFAVPEQTKYDSRLELRVRGNHSLEKREFSNIEVGVLPSTTEGLIDSVNFEQTTTQNFKNISIPLSFSPSTYMEASKDSSNLNECGQKDSSATKKYFDSNLPYFEYNSEKGNYCEHFEFRSLSHGLSYFVIVKSQNIEGLPMTFCATNYTSRKCDIFAKLSDFEGVQSDIFFLPATDVDGLGYDINIENRSVKGSPSTNRLYSVQFVPIQSELVNKIQTGEIAHKSFDGNIESITNITPLSLLLELDNKPTLLELSYAYHEGFEAYKIQCENNFECLLKSAISPINGERLPHGKGSSWNNVWEYYPSNSNDEKVIIVFQPQYLQYIGFILLLIPLGYLLFPSFEKVFVPAKKLDMYFKVKSDFFRKKVMLRLGPTNIQPPLFKL